MKKNLGTIVVAIIVLLVVFLLSIPFINNHLASRIATEIEEIPLPENTTYIESVSRADKMNLLIMENCHLNMTLTKMKIIIFSILGEKGLNCLVHWI